MSVCKEELAETDQSFSNFWELPSSIIWTWQSSIWKDKQDIALFPLLFEKGGVSYCDDAERSFIIKVIGVTLKVCIHRKPAHTELVFGKRLQRRFCFVCIRIGTIFLSSSRFHPLHLSFSKLLPLLSGSLKGDLFVKNGPIASVPDLKS